MFHSKLLLFALLVLLTASCASLPRQASYHPRLTQAQAVRLAQAVPYPRGWDRRLYAYRGDALFLEPTHQWAVTFEVPPGRTVPIGADYFSVCINDATGKFDHYEFAD